MKYTTSAQERQVWFCLACVWFVTSLAAWAVAVYGDWPPLSSPSGLTMLALLAAAVSLDLRLPILTNPPVTSPAIDGVVWLLCFTANINWLGCFYLLSGAGPGAIWPGLVIVALAEIWFLYHLRTTARVAWLSDIQSGNVEFQGEETGVIDLSSRSDFARDLNPLVSHEISITLNSGNSQRRVKPPTTPEELPAAAHATMLVEAEPESNREPTGAPATRRDRGESFDAEGTSVLRQLVDGLDETGRRFISGEILLDFQPNQKSETLVVGFCPAFDGVPTLDLDIIADEVENGCDPVTFSVVNCTQLGMRMVARRKQSSQPLSAQLMWYAAENTQSRDSDDTSNPKMSSADASTSGHQQVIEPHRRLP